ncbi:MAG: hypothetical protein ACKOXG_06965 [Arenimonas sp.]
MKAIVIAFASLFVSTAALAADPVAVLGSAEGQVMVSKDKKFVTVQTGQVLKPGDRVLVLQDGAALVRFNDGCELALPESSLAVVPKISTCAGGNAEIAQLSPESAQALGLGKVAMSASGLWAVGGLPAAGVAAGESGDDETVSP